MPGEYCNFDCPGATFFNGLTLTIPPNLSIVGRLIRLIIVDSMPILD